MSNTIASAAWWKAAVIRALRTALVIAAPYIGGASLAGIPWLSVASAAGLGFIASLVTSLFGLPEVDGSTSPLWLAWTTRVVKSIAQALATGIGQAALFQDVHWVTVLQTSLIAGFGSLVLAVIRQLPESAPIINAGTAAPGAPSVITNAHVAAPPAAIASAVADAVTPAAVTPAAPPSA